MTMTLFCGPRGSGKTRYIYEDIFFMEENTTKPLYLLVAEQKTYRHEYRLEKERNRRFLYDLEITSFNKLAQKYLYETVPEGVGQYLLLYKILKSRSDDFASMKLLDLRSGFIEEAKAVLDEAFWNSLSPDRIRAKSEELAKRDDVGDLPKKLWDIALMMEEADKLEDSNFFHTGRLLEGFERAVREKKLFSDAVFYFDDFYDFTVPEYALIEALLENGADVKITLLWDKNDSRLVKADKIRRKLIGLSCKVGVEVNEVYLDSSNGDIPELTFLAQKGGDLGQVFDGSCQAVQILVGETKGDEVEIIAEKMCELKQQGYDEGDMVVFLRDPQSYLPVFKEIFPMYNVACHYDEALPLEHTPVFAYSEGLVRVAEERWSFPSVFALLKTGLFPLEKEEIDVFENYCLAHAINGKRFYSDADWTFEDKENDLAFVNEIRKKVRNFLLPFVEKLKQDSSVREYSETIWHFIQKSPVEEQLKQWREIEIEAGRLLKGEELVQCLPRLADLLDQMVAVFGDAEMSFTDFADLFRLGIRTQKMRTIPLAHHEAEVAVLGVSRPERCKIAFVCGVNESVFPGAFGGGGFLNSGDRNILGDEADFWYQNRDTFYENEDFLIYQTLTAATEKLFVLYHERDNDGSKAEPSSLITTLESFFPDLKAEPCFREMREKSGAVFWSPERALQVLPALLREGVVDKSSVDSCLESTEQLVHWDKAAESLDYTGGSRPLSPELCKRYLYGDLYVNVSSLDVYNRCQFAYFAKYDLKLRERKELVFKVQNFGTLLHEALRLLLSCMANEGIPWQELENHSGELLPKIVGELLADFGETNLFSGEKQAFLQKRLTDQLLFVTKVMANRQELGDEFIPVKWEASFGNSDDGSMEALRLSLQEGDVIVTGQIDRVDVVEKDDKTFFRVIDYKSGGKTLDLGEVCLGMKIQLFVYLLVMENHYKKEGKTPIPGGVFYLPLKEFFVKPKGDYTDVSPEIMKEASFNGYVINDESVPFYGENDEKKKVINEVENRAIAVMLNKMIKKAATEIYNGFNAINPYIYKNGATSVSSCEYCPYTPVCGYDPLLMGKERVLYGLKEANAKAKILKEGGEE